MKTDRLPDLLRVNAEQTPNAVAVVDGDVQCTWAQLASLATRISHVLVDDGVAVGDRVGLWLDKSIAAVAGLYGIMLAGGCYVPLDPGAPVDRLGRIARSAGFRVVLSDTEHSDQWSPLIESSPSLEHVVVLDGEVPAATLADVVGARVTGLGVILASSPEAAVTASRTARDLAYVLYTSGSTGEPKGVMHTHASCLAFVDWAVREYGVHAQDRLSSHAPFHFDLSTFDLFAAARSGARTVLAPRAASVFPMSLRGLIENQGITVWYSVPAVLIALSRRAGLRPGHLPALRVVLFAGEVFPTPVLRDLMAQLPHARFANLYGPTETNVCTAWTCTRPLPEGDGPIPIGATIDPDEAMAVGEDGRIVEDGQTGELWVSGGSVMAGYLGDPRLSIQSLATHPNGRRDQLWYRTGDLVRRAPDESWLYLGRRDAQVKVRGHRIELGEVEAALHRHGAVAEAVVLAVPDGAGSNRLVAVVSVTDNTNARQLQRHCARLLPSVMVPADVTLVGRLPRTSTGKIDRRALTPSIPP